MDTVCSLYQSFQEGTGPSSAGLMGRTKEAAGRPAGAQAGDALLLRNSHKHMSATERLRKVIQELVDTEKSYVKVSPPRSVSPPFLIPCSATPVLEFDLPPHPPPPRRFTAALVVFLTSLCPSLHSSSRPPPVPPVPPSETLASLLICN